jgi:hypothetical protein
MPCIHWQQLKYFRLPGTSAPDSDTEWGGASFLPVAICAWSQHQDGCHETRQGLGAARVEIATLIPVRDFYRDSQCEGVLNSPPLC